MTLKKKFIFISKNIYFDKLKNGNLKRKAGVNFSGKKTVRGRGYIIKQKKREIDHFKAFWHVKACVLNFEYDPKKKTLINLLLYFNGVFTYSLAIEEVFTGAFIQNGIKIPLKKGNTTLLSKILKNIKICNVETKLFSGAKISRSSFCFSKIIAKNKRKCTLKLSSKKKKIISSFSTATIGSIFSFNFYLKRYKNAGLLRIKGFRPKVRGVAQNPVDHPHGGGEGKKSKKKSPMNLYGKIKRSKK